MIRYAPPLRILYYDTEARRECVFTLVSGKLNMYEYESECTGLTILLSWDEAVKHAI